MGKRKELCWEADRVVRHVLEPLWGQIEGLLEEDVFNLVRMLDVATGHVACRTIETSERVVGNYCGSIGVYLPRAIPHI